MCSTFSITHHSRAVRGNLGFSVLPKDTPGKASNHCYYDYWTTLSTFWAIATGSTCRDKPSFTLSFEFPISQAQHACLWAVRGSMSIWRKKNTHTHTTCWDLNWVLCVLESTYRHQLLTFAGLTESQYAVQIDAGLFLVTVLYEAESLKVEPGNHGQAIVCHVWPLVHWTAGGGQSYLVYISKQPSQSSICTEGVHFCTRRRSCAARSAICCKWWEYRSSDPAGHGNWKQDSGPMMYFLPQEYAVLTLTSIFVFW